MGFGARADPNPVAAGDRPAPVPTNTGAFGCSASLSFIARALCSQHVVTVAVFYLFLATV